MNKTDYDGIINKPSMEEVLYHGAFHKYLNKYMGKNGKWVYVYNQAKNAASGAMNKAKAALPGLQKQAMSTAVSTRNKVGSAVSSGSKQASALKKKAQSKVSSMLPILSKKLNSAKKKARSQAAGVKLVARDKTKKLKKTAQGTYEQAKKTAKTAKNSNAYQRAKRKVGEKIGAYSKSTSKKSATKGDSRYRNTGNLSSRGYQSSKSSQVGLGSEQYYNDGRYFYNAQGKPVSTNTTNRLKRKQSGRNSREYIKRTSRKRR